MKYFNLFVTFLLPSSQQAGTTGKKRTQGWETLRSFFGGGCAAAAVCGAAPRPGPVRACGPPAVYVEALRPPRLPGLRRGRSAPRAPRVTLSMEKESPESQAGENPPPPPYGTLLLLGKRSRSARPCPTGARPHQAQECLARKQPPKIVPYRGS